MAANATKLQVSEVFRSIQGEGTRAGRPCQFVRLAGCNLRCVWCDTPYAWEGGAEMTVGEILARLRRATCPLALVTGGEPLMQPRTPELLHALCEDAYEVLLETNGTYDISALDGRVVRIVDIKCPSSGQTPRVRWANLRDLRPVDEVKLVLAGRDDYEFACRAVAEHSLVGRCHVIFSPVAGRLAPADLAQWILQDDLDVRLGLQLHKIIWPGGEPKEHP